MWTPSAALQSDMESRAKKPFINKIEIIGIESFSEKELKKKMHTKEPSFFSLFNKPRLRESYLKRDVAYLEAFYHAQGFYEASVKLKDLVYSDDGRFVDIVIEVHEGEATRVENVSIDAPPLVDLEELEKSLYLEPGRPFNASLIEADIYLVKNAFARKGCPAATVTDSLRFLDHRVDIIYSVDPGPKLYLHQIVVAGNRMTKESIIRKELTFDEGELFNLDELKRSRRNLFDTGLFTEAEIEPRNVDLTERSVDILVRVRERKSSYVEFGFGVGNVLGSRISAEWGNRNVFGTGRAVILKAQHSFDIFRDSDVDIGKLKLRTKFIRYDGEFRQRHLFGTGFLVGINGFYEKDATVEPIEINTTGASVIGSRRFGRRTDLLLSLSHERITRDIPELPRERSTSRIASASLNMDRRDFLLNPTRGSYRSVRLDVAGGILGGDNDFYSILVSLQKYLSLGSRSVAAFRVRMGYADAFGKSADAGLPIENRFFTGGGNSVRGYSENSLGPRGVLEGSAQALTSEGVVGGRVLLISNAELRFPLPYVSRFNFSGALFVDGGNVWSGMRQLKPKYFRPYAPESEVVEQDYRYSFGLGLRYNTPVGPIRLDYGIPVKREPEMDKSGRIHVSLGHIF